MRDEHWQPRLVRGEAALWEVRGEAEARRGSRANKGSIVLRWYEGGCGAGWFQEGIEN